MKKLIAYSSVAHMGFVTMGIFAGTTQGVAGGMFQMVSHGIVSAALFLCVGVVYDRMHTREIAAYGGLVNRMPLYALVFMVFTLANVGLPGTSGFVGEFLTLLGTFKVTIPVATFATLGVILSAGLCAVALSQGGVRRADKAVAGQHQGPDLRESLTLFPLVIADHPVRRLSEAGARHVGGLGPATRQQLQAAVTAVKAAALVASEGRRHELLECRLSVAAGAAGAGAGRRRHGAADARRLSRRGDDAGSSPRLRSCCWSSPARWN